MSHTPIPLHLVRDYLFRLLDSTDIPFDSTQSREKKASSFYELLRFAKLGHGFFSYFSNRDLQKRFDSMNFFTFEQNDRLNAKQILDYKHICMGLIYTYLEQCWWHSYDFLNTGGLDNLDNRFSRLKDADLFKPLEKQEFALNLDIKIHPRNPHILSKGHLELGPSQYSAIFDIYLAMNLINLIENAIASDSVSLWLNAVFLHYGMYSDFSDKLIALDRSVKHKFDQISRKRLTELENTHKNCAALQQLLYSSTYDEIPCNLKKPKSFALEEKLRSYRTDCLKSLIKNPPAHYSAINLFYDLAASLKRMIVRILESHFGRSRELGNDDICLKVSMISSSSTKITGLAPSGNPQLNLPQDVIKHYFNDYEKPKPKEKGKILPNGEDKIFVKGHIDPHFYSTLKVSIAYCIIQTNRADYKFFDLAKNLSLRPNQYTPIHFRK
jgi:hypothetical protein